MDGNDWIVAGLVLVVILQFVAIILLIRILTQGEIVVRAIPLGSPRLVERRLPPTPQHRGD